MLDGTTLRDGVFALNTRRFGSVAEEMIQRMVDLGKARARFHDLYDDVANHRIEVKFSRVQRKSETAIRPSTVLQCIEEATAANRLVAFSEWREFEFDCNIQQVKKAEFDVLYYGLFFSDCVAIFRILSGDIGPLVSYSDKQHKGNVGEGQFHINRSTLEVHLDRFLYRTVSYEDLLTLLK